MRLLLLGNIGAGEIFVIFLIVLAIPLLIYWLTCKLIDRWKTPRY